MEVEDMGSLLKVFTVYLSKKDIYPMNSQRNKQIFDHVELTGSIHNVPMFTFPNTQINTFSHDNSSR